MPISLAALIGASWMLHGIALVEWLDGSALAAGTALFYGQIVLGIILIRVADGAWLFHDVRLLFLGALSLYGGVLPLGALVGAMEQSGGLTHAVTLFAAATASFNVVQAVARQPLAHVTQGQLAPEPAANLDIALFLAAVGFVFAFAAVRGVTFTPSFDRTRLELVYSQLWIVAAMVVNGTAMFLIARYRHLASPQRLLLLAALALYVLFHLSLGNRRDFLPLMLFAAAVYSSVNGRRINARFVIVSAVAFVALLGLGIVRAIVASPLLVLEDPLTVLFVHNEFAYPIQTLTFYVEQSAAPLLGASYAEWPMLFVPRSIWPDKPVSLSFRFLLDAFGTTEFQGFAYTPVTEAFLNFGYVGPALVFAALSVLLVWMVRNASRFPALYFICLALVVDFHRGEMAATIYSVIVLLAVYSFLRYLAARPHAAGTAASPAGAQRHTLGAS